MDTGKLETPRKIATAEHQKARMAGKTLCLLLGLALLLAVVTAAPGQSISTHQCEISNLSRHLSTCTTFMYILNTKST